MSNDSVLTKLEEAFDDKDNLLFYLSWIKNGLNASKAYKELHPNVTDKSAGVLGSRQLEKVSKSFIMQAYGLDAEAYFNQLKEGLNAKGMTKDGDVYDDHRARRPYHEVLGKLLGIEEKERDQGNQQFTQFNILNINKEETEKEEQSFREWMLRDK